MFAHVCNAYAEPAAALVDIEFTSLEDGHYRLVGRVEITQYHIVAKQLVEVSHKVGEFVHLVYGVGLVLKGFVFFDKLKQGGFVVCFEQLLYFFQAQGLNFCALLGVFPCHIRLKRSHECVPFLLVDSFSLQACEVLESIEPGLPCGVDTVEAEDAVLDRAGERIRGNLFCLCGKVMVRYGCDAFCRHVYRRGGELGEGDELATHEVVCHLLFEGVCCVKCGCSIVSEGEDICGSGFLPCGVICQGGVESLYLVCGDTCYSAAVCCRADIGCHCSDNVLKMSVLRRSIGNDAVSVEGGFGKDGNAVGGVCNRNFILLKLEV